MAAGSVHVGTPVGVTEETLKDSDRVLEFYRNATVLVTGGTGFLGKVLLEKILRCLNVRKVYLLIRAKDSQRPAERLQSLLMDAIFEPLRKVTSIERLLERLEPVEISLGASDPTGLGIEPTTEVRLLQETELVFNVLASVKFNECISTAIGTNVCGTRRVLLLARRMHRLRAVVHVSTLYSNCDRAEIGERVYPDARFTPDTVLQLSTALSAAEMDGLQHCLVGALPNTYTFSKKCAESLIQRQFSDMPVGIFRPPIVLSTYREPLAGWTDNLNGPAGLCLWTVKGYVHVIRGNRHRRANLVPVDYCVNAMLVAGFDVAERDRRRHTDEGKAWEREQLEVPVYNYMYAESGLTWGRYMGQVSLGFDGLLHRLWWNFSYTIVPNRVLFLVLSVCCHTVPARLLDVVRRLRGKNPRYRKLVAKTSWFLETMSYFGLREWNIANDNVVRLRSLLSPTEARLLEFDLTTIDWDEYFRAYIPGIRRYVLDEPEPPKSRWSAPWNRRIHFLCRLLHKLLWILVCLKLGHRLYVLRHLFPILVS